MLAEKKLRGYFFCSTKYSINQLDGAKSNARTRRERTAMSLEGILASCMKAEKIASESQRKYSWERGPDREKGNEDGV